MEIDENGHVVGIHAHFVKNFVLLKATSVVKKDNAHTDTSMNKKHVAENGANEDGDLLHAFIPNGFVLPSIMRKHIKGDAHATLPAMTKLIEGGHVAEQRAIYGNNLLHWACHDLGAKPATDYNEVTERIPSSTSAGVIQFLLKRVNPRVKNVSIAYLIFTHCNMI